MRKIILCFMMLGVIAVTAACAVKSDLDKPDSGYPRNYPVY